MSPLNPTSDAQSGRRLAKLLVVTMLLVAAGWMWLQGSPLLFRQSQRTAANEAPEPVGRFTPVRVVDSFSPIVTPDRMDWLTDTVRSEAELRSLERMPPILAAADVHDEVSDNELVLGVVINGEARAWPINMLTGPTREIINDRLGGRNIAATW